MSLKEILSWNRIIESPVRIRKPLSFIKTLQQGYTIFGTPYVLFFVVRYYAGTAGAWGPTPAPPKIIRIRVEIPNRNWSSYVVWAPHLPKLMDCPAEPRTLQYKCNPTQAGPSMRGREGGRREAARGQFAHSLGEHFCFCFVDDVCNKSSSIN